MDASGSMVRSTTDVVQIARSAFPFWAEYKDKKTKGLCQREEITVSMLIELFGIVTLNRTYSSMKM
jgi:hypothetical protein